jgi:hypothetical protein
MAQVYIMVLDGKPLNKNSRAKGGSCWMPNCEECPCGDDDDDDDDGGWDEISQDSCLEFGRNLNRCVIAGLVLVISPVVITHVALGMVSRLSGPLGSSSSQRRRTLELILRAPDS